MIRVISSPSSSTTGLFTLIFAIDRRSSRGTRAQAVRAYWKLARTPQPASPWPGETGCTTQAAAGAIAGCHRAAPSGLSRSPPSPTGRGRSSSRVRRRSRLPAELTAAGIDPADVRTVVPTHLHSDHVGWAVVGTPWFPSDCWSPATCWCRRSSSSTPSCRTPTRSSRKRRRGGPGAGRPTPSARLTCWRRRPASRGRPRRPP
ncbi:MBL fold metallo-hydrolase [Micromonospora sp. ATCC 39149]|uniref:MBL fold metallo-hydrolase n=1 Tax=Micromonospora sp. (strain ATCC 39149 / NRRL 15099 / SCC 1413) TaxID=219305 RepID=UPI001E39383C|nr:MBL fold metallo-hydrolase [Micromonospora sp. ATCC 39149]